MAKKIVRLTESDMNRLIKKVVLEQLKSKPVTHVDPINVDRPKLGTTLRPMNQKLKSGIENYKKNYNSDLKNSNFKYEQSKIKQNQIKQGTNMSSIFTSDLGGVRVINDSEFMFNVYDMGNNFEYDVRKELSYSVDSQPFKLIRGDYNFSRLLDGRQEFNDTKNAIKILDDMVRKRTATKRGDTYTFKSKDGQKDVVVATKYFITHSGVSPRTPKLIVTDDNGAINDPDFIERFNKRSPVRH